MLFCRRAARRANLPDLPLPGLSLKSDLRDVPHPLPQHGLPHGRVRGQDRDDPIPIRPGEFLTGAHRKHYKGSTEFTLLILT